MCKSALFFPTVIVGAVITLCATAQPSQAQYVGDRAGWFPSGVVSDGPAYAVFGQGDYGYIGSLRWGWGWGFRYYWFNDCCHYPYRADWLYWEPYYYSEPAAVYYVAPPQVMPIASTAANVPPTLKRDSSATVQVLVPPDAELWLDGNKLEQTGSVRSISTPSLAPGKTLKHEVRATWVANGQPVTQTREVQVQAGNQRIVNFMVGGGSDAKN